VHLPANTFSARHESRGETGGTSRGTTVSTSASANTKGSWTALGSATSFAYEGFTVYLSRSSGAGDYLVDIGVDDGAGNNFALLPDLHAAFAKIGAETNLAINVPIHVAAGALLEARSQSLAGLQAIDVLIVGHSANPGGFPGYSRAITLFTPASSRGINVDPGGTANTKGTWTQLTASSSNEVAAIFGVVGFNSDTARAANAGMLLDVGVGGGGSEFVCCPNLAFAWGTVWDGPNDVFFQPLPVMCPAGTRFAARAQCSVNTDSDRDIDLALYGLVP
jgi:hypothetical protein